MGVKEIVKRNYIFMYKQEAFEVYKDFGHGYDQEELNKYWDLVKGYKQRIIENSDDKIIREEAAAIQPNVPENKYIYDRDERKKMLDIACKQLTDRQTCITERIKKIEKTKNVSKKSLEDQKDELELLKRQSVLLDQMKQFLTTREEELHFYQNNQERDEAQLLKANKAEEQREAKDFKGKTFKQWKSQKFRTFRKNTGQKDRKGISSSKECEKKRLFREFCQKMFYKQDKIDFEELFREFDKI